MALTRRMLKAMGISDEQVDEIIAAHTETVDALKEQRDQYKTDAEALPGIKAELEAAKEAAANAGKDSWKVKYDALKEEYDGYKTEQDKKAAHSAKEKAYRDLLRECKVSDKRMDAILKVTNLDELEIAENGAFKSADEIKKNIQSEWADFIETTTTTGTTTTRPPASGGSAKSKDEIMAIKDTAARQRAIAENLELFQGN